MKHAQPLTTLFFILLGAGLLLGDGKQWAIDVYGVSITLVLWMYSFVLHIPIRRLPPRLSVPWAAFGAASFVSTLFSDSIGFSVSWLVRFVCGYLLYRLFYSAASPKTAQRFIAGSAFLVLGASFFSLLSRISPFFRSVLPSMNLIDLRYGHSHLADLMVFLVPIVVWIFGNTRPPFFSGMTAVVLYGIVLISTVARGAWIMVAAYAGVRYIFRDPGSRKTRIVRFAIFFLAALIIGLVGGFWFGSRRTDHPVTAWFSTIFRPYTVSGRLEYWRQAAVAFSERPIFGSGPGTFSLQSVRLQRAEGQSSWFAHSLPLQTAAETGLVGLLALLWLIGINALCAGQLFRTKPDGAGASGAIAQGVALLLLYATIEFVLDFQVIWLLFWAGTGLVVGSAGNGTHETAARARSMIFPLGFISFFYALWIVSSSALLFSKRYDLAFFLAPFDATNTAVMLTASRGEPLSDRTAFFVRLFHKKNPVVLLALAKKYQAEARSCDEIFTLDKKNQSSWQECMKLLFTQNEKKLAGALLYEMVREIAPSGAQWRISYEDFINPGLFNSLTLADVDSFVNSPQYKNAGLAKFLYRIGLQSLGDDPELTKRLWVLAREVSPRRSFFHVELASLDAWVFRDAQSARRRLARCAEERDARYHCVYILTHDIPPVGSYKNHIAAIPKNL